MTITTITTKGQVTIPKDVRQSLGLQEGDKVAFIVENDRAILVPLTRGRALSELFGALPATRPYSGQEAARQEMQAELGARIQRGEE